MLQNSYQAKILDTISAKQEKAVISRDGSLASLEQARSGKYYNLKSTSASPVKMVTK